jgi:hypothetical protein
MANKRYLERLVLEEMSLINMLNKIVLRMKPFGTPNSIGNEK